MKFKGRATGNSVIQAWTVDSLSPNATSSTWLETERFPALYKDRATGGKGGRAQANPQSLCLG